MDQLKEKVAKVVQDNLEETIQLTQQLIRYPSTSRNEKEAQMFYAEQLQKLSCEVDIWEPDIEKMKTHPAFLTTRENFTGSPNVIGVLRGIGGGRSIILNGHVDVVPEGQECWKDSPWSGKVIDGKIYGRGASDMKGGNITNLMALKAIQSAGIKLKGNVIIESVVEEEAGGAGTLAAIMRGYRADGAIIPEPSDLKIYPVAMGSMWFRVRVKGYAAHGATAYLGVNALEKAALILNALKELQAKRSVQKSHPLYRHMPIPFCINVGTMRGGAWPSSVPVDAVMEGRMGVSPDETIEEAKIQLEEAIQKIAASDDWLKDNIPEIEWFGSCWNSGGIEIDHPLIDLVQNNYLKIMGKAPEIVGAPWATDAGVLIRYGGIPTIIFGPGTGTMAHQSNEYIEIENMIKAIKIIAFTILDWCGYEDKQ